MSDQPRHPAGQQGPWSGSHPQPDAAQPYGQPNQPNQPYPGYDAPTQQFGPAVPQYGPPAQQPGRKPRRWLHWVGYPVALIAGVAIGAGGSSSNSDPSTTAAAGPAATVTATAPADDGAAAAPATVTRTVTTQPKPAAADSSAPVKKPAASASFADGTYVVGKDIKAGTYLTKGGDGCYWARLKNTSGDFGAIIANGNITGQTTVTIKKSDGAFEASGGCRWTMR